MMNKFFFSISAGINDLKIHNSVGGLPSLQGPPPPPPRGEWNRCLRSYDTKGT